MTEPTVQIEASDLILEYLTILNVEYVFGIPGGAIEPLFNALARSERKNGPKVVVARHETGSAFMADGYARNSGKLGVCCATTGPGATNLITGVASAYENHIPLLVITAQTSLENFGRGAFQESSDTGVNILGMFQFCTKYNTLVSHINQLEQKLISALFIAINDCCPVHISVPIDILAAKITHHNLHNAQQCFKNTLFSGRTQATELIDALRTSNKTVFVLGPGCANAIWAIQQCATVLGAAIVATPDGKGFISPYHPLFKGVIGFAGHEQAEQALRDPEVEAIVAVGTSLSEWATNSWDGETLINEKLIHIDPFSANLSRTPLARLRIQGQIFPLFQELLTHLNTHPLTPKHTRKADTDPSPLPGIAEHSLPLPSGWENQKVLPQWLMHQLPKKLPPYTRFLADVGNSMAWAIHYLHPYDRRMAERRVTTRAQPTTRRSAFAGLFQTTVNFAAMGWAIGAAIGAALANSCRPTVCITGDGSLLMNGQEISVALQHNLAIVFIVLNDASLGMVKHGQRLTDAEKIGFELPPVDFAMMAQAMGVKGVSIRCPQDLLDLNLDAYLLEQGPVLLDVHIDPEQVPPILSRTNSLHADTHKNLRVMI